MGVSAGVAQGVRVSGLEEAAGFDVDGGPRDAGGFGWVEPFPAVQCGVVGGAVQAAVGVGVGDPGGDDVGVDAGEQVPAATPQRSGCQSPR